MTSPLPVAIDARRAQWMGHTGIGRYVRELLAHGASEARIRYVGLLAAGQEPPAGHAVWLRFRPGLRPLGRVLWEQAAEPWAIRRSAASVLHLPWYEGTPVPGVPLVLTIQDLHSLTAAQDHPLTFRYYNALLRILARRARLVIAPSASTAEQLGRVGVSDDRIRVISYGHDPRLAGVRSTGPRLGSTQTILYCGGYGPRKRVDVLLRAFAQLAPDRPQARLVLVGVVPTDVRGIGDRLELTERLDMPGRVSDAELRSLYSRADAVAYPSEHEGFGFPALDALTAEVPLVACDTSSIPEVAGEAGWLVEPGNPDAFAEALARVLDVGSGVAERVARGRVRAAEFTWDRCVRAHADVYLEAADRRAPQWSAR